jgi:hypothetical protein
MNLDTAHSAEVRNHVTYNSLVRPTFLPHSDYDYLQPRVVSGKHRDHNLNFESIITLPSQYPVPEPLPRPRRPGPEGAGRPIAERGLDSLMAPESMSQSLLSAYSLMPYGTQVHESIFEGKRIPPKALARPWA